MGIFLNKSYNISHRVQTHVIKSLIMALSLFKLAKYKIKYCLCCHSQKRRNKKSQKFLLKDQYQNLMPKIRAFFFHQMLPLASVENSDRIYNTIWHFDRIKKWGCWKKNLIQMTFKAHTALHSMYTVWYNKIAHCLFCNFKYRMHRQEFCCLRIKG